MTRRRIGIFDSSEHVSGISRYVESILGALRREDDFDVTLFCRTNGPYRAMDGVAIVRIDEPQSAEGSMNGESPVVRSALRRGWRKYSPGSVNLLAGFGKSSLRLSKLFAQHRVDLLHVQVVGAEEAAPAAKIAGIRRVVGTLHIDSSQSGLHRWPVEAMTNHCLDRAIAVSQATADDWTARTALPARSVVTIANGVDVDHFRQRRSSADARLALGLNVSAPLLVAVGRLSMQKGYSFLIDAVAKLSPRYPDLQLTIAGDGPLCESLLGQAKSLGVASRVKLLGATADVRPILEAGDLFVLPSLWEAMPYALLEAMSMGLPPVATRVAGVPEVIEHGRSGWLVPPGDAQALADAIGQSLADDRLRSAASTAARQRIVAHYDERAMTALTLDVYRALLAGASRRPQSTRITV